MQTAFLFETKITLANRGDLKAFLSRSVKIAKHPFGALTYVFCSDAYLLDINRTNLGHNYLTDIITFNLAAEGEPIQGEIYISTDRAREQALEHHVPLREELHRLIFHGALHLCGYKDKSAQEKQRMTKLEDEWLLRYGIVSRETRP